MHKCDKSEIHAIYPTNNLLPQKQYRYNAHLIRKAPHTTRPTIDFLKSTKLKFMENTNCARSCALKCG